METTANGSRRCPQAAPRAHRASPRRRPPVRRRPERGLLPRGVDAAARRPAHLRIVLNLQEVFANPAHDNRPAPHGRLPARRGRRGDDRVDAASCRLPIDRVRGQGVSRAAHRERFCREPEPGGEPPYLEFYKASAFNRDCDGGERSARYELLSISETIMEFNPVASLGDEGSLDENVFRPHRKGQFGITYIDILRQFHVVQFPTAEYEPPVRFRFECDLLARCIGTTTGHFPL